MHPDITECSSLLLIRRDYEWLVIFFEVFILEGLLGRNSLLRIILEHPIQQCQSMVIYLFHFDVVTEWETLRLLPLDPLVLFLVLAQRVELL